MAINVERNRSSSRRLLGHAFFLIAIVQSLPAIAQRVGWMPGDAIFAASHQSVQRINDTGAEAEAEAIVFVHSEYPDPEHDGLYSYGGFFRLVLTGDHDSLKNVSTAIDFAASTTTHDASKAGQICHIVLNREFDFERWRIGLRYNENWFQRPQQKPSLGRRADRLPFVKYSTLMKSRDCVILDWRDANSVPPLSVSLPLQRSDWALAGEPIMEPVQAKLSQVVICVIETDKIESCCLRETSASCFLVDGDGGLSLISWTDTGALEKQKIR